MLYKPVKIKLCKIQAASSNMFKSIISDLRANPQF